MSKIAVYHPYFGQGGAESVCMHVLEALQDDHDLTLFSMSDVDVAEQNEYFDTDVRPTVETSRLGAPGRAVSASMTSVERIAGRRLGRLHAALFSRLMRDRPQFDLLFSTHGEIVTDLPSVQYIHYPWYNRSRIPDTIERQGPFETAYNRLCHLLSGHDDEAVREQRLLTNSEWTASVVEGLYGVRPETVYPPLVTDSFDPIPWEERENGFVCVGRLSPEKNVRRNVDVVGRLRERGHDVHLHVVGPGAETEEGRQIERVASSRSYVTLEGRVSRDRLVELVCGHRYGIHGKEHEHFGIAVAELVAGGTIPFVPNSGGQREIVDERSALLYDTADEAVEKADAVLSDPDVQRSVRRSLPDVAERFGPERFERRVREVVDEVLSAGP